VAQAAALTALAQEELLIPSQSWNFKKIESVSRALVARICNLSYSGGSDQEDSGSKPAFLEKTHYKKGLVECLKV
jgi:hypothetical protein